jgi:hypothetical protein
MKSTLLWGLVFLNIVLLFGLALRLTSQPAVAQIPRASDYIMIPGDIVGASSGAVYVVDTNLGRLTAISFDDTQNRLSVMQPVDLNGMFQAAAAGGIRH